MSRKSFAFFIPLLILALAALACDMPGSGPAGGTTPSVSASPTAESVEPTDVPEVEPTAEPSGNGSSGTAEQTRSIKTTNVDEQLNALSSYSANIVYSVKGKDADDKDVELAFNMLMEYSKEAKSQHIKMTTSGIMTSTAMPQEFEIFRVDNTMYIYGAMTGKDVDCLALSSDSMSGMDNTLPKPSNILPGLENVELVAEGEMVNDIKTNHYKFDQTNVKEPSADAEITNAKGDVWIAQDGDYVVKYTMTAEGKHISAASGTLNEGTLDLTFELTQINNDVTIELPKECADKATGAADDVPIPDNVTDKTSMAGIVTFKSPDAPDAVAEFYKTALPDNGWTEGDGNALPGMFVLQYTKDDRTLSVTIMKDQAGDGSTVTIVEAKK